MQWWLIGLGIVIVIILIYFLTRYLDNEKEEYGIEKLSDLIREGKDNKVKKKSKRFNGRI